MELGALDSLARVAPECVLLATLCIVAFVGGRFSPAAAADIAILGAASSLFVVARLHGWGEVWVLRRTFVVDEPALCGKACASLALVGALWGESRETARLGRIVRSIVAAIALGAA